MTQEKLYYQSPEDWKPHAYQKKAAKFLLQRSHAGLFLDPGLGKTSISLAVISALKKAGKLERCLIAAPLRVIYSVWPNEIEKWNDFRHLTYTIVHGPKKDKLLHENTDIHLITHDSLKWLYQAETRSSNRVKSQRIADVDMKHAKSLPYNFLFLDELAKYKNYGSSRVSILKKVRHLYDRIYGLTGSPAPNGLLNLFGQFLVLDGGKTFSPYITHYQKKFFVKGYDGFSWEPKSEEHVKLIYEHIEPTVIAMKAEDYLDMPQMQHNKILFSLPDDIQKIYDQLEDDLVTEISNKTVSAATSLTASMKIRQIVSGGVYIDDEVEVLKRLPKRVRDWIFVHDMKTDIVESLVEELQGSPLLVAYEFTHDVERLKMRFGKDIPVIGGKTRPKEVDKTIDAWNKGKIPLCLINAKSAGHGLNLQQASNHILWHSLTWDYEHYDQLIRRIYRQGNKFGTVFVHHALAKGTIDERMYYVLNSKKKKNQNALFTALTELAKLKGGKQPKTRRKVK